MPLPGASGSKQPAAEAAQADPFADLDLSDTALDGPPIAPPSAVPLPGIGHRAASGAQPPPPPKVDDDPFGLDLPPPPAQAFAAPPPKPPALLPDDGGLSFDFIDEVKAQPSQRPAGASATGPELLDFVDDVPDEDTALRPKGADDALVPKSAGSLGEKRGAESHLMPKATDTAVTPRSQSASRPGVPRAPPMMTPGASAPPPPLVAARGPGVDRAFVLPSPAPEVAAGKKKSEPLGPKIAAALGPLGERLGSAGQWAVRNKKVLSGATGALLLVLVAGLGVRAGSTDAGYFWMNKISPRMIATGEGRKEIDVAADKLSEGNFLDTRAALGTAAKVLQGAPDDDDVRSFFVLCASELKLMYGQGGVDWDLAQRTVEKLKAETPRVQRARAAYVLASGDAAKAKLVLQPLVDRGAAEAQGVFLYAQALVRLKEYKGAAAALDAALKIGKQPPGKLLLARAMVARAQGQLPEAAQLFAATLERQPQNGRAMIELADVKREQDDFSGALALLDKSLQPEQKKALDASEEARAMLLRAEIFAAQRRGAQAEAAFERAVELDPQSSDVRGTYGAWRASRHEYEKALRHLDVALAKDPTNAALIDPAARSLLGLGKPLDASKRVSDGLRKLPDDPTLLFLQGKVEEGFAKPTEAMKSYEAALKKKPDHAEALVASAFLLLANDDKEGANKRLQQAEASPDGKKRPAVHLVIGDLRLALGDNDGARAHYAKALEMDPDDAQAHASLGRALSAMGENDRARHELEIALKTLDQDAPLLYEYGSLLRRVGDRAAAAGPLEKAVKLASGDFRFRARLGALRFEQGDIPGAEKELRAASLLGEKWAETYFFLGRTFAAQKKLPEAIEQLRKAIELEPNRAEHHYELGLAYEQTAQIGEAIKSFSAAIERDPKLASAHEHIGRNYMVQSVYDDAILHFAKAAELDPKRPGLIALQADAEHQAGKMDEAIAHYKKALERDPRLPGMWSRLGVVFKDKACGDCRRLAVAAFLRAEQVDPKDAAARRELGYVYKEDGRRIEAIAEFKKYIELKPDAADADQVKDDIYFLSEEKKRSP